MDRIDLYYLLGFLQCVRNYECIVDNLLAEECDELIQIVRLELKNDVK